MEATTESTTVATLERQNRELAILNTIATALNGSMDLATSLSAVLSRVGELLDLGTGWVLLYDDAGRRPYLAAAQNLPPGLADEPERMEGTCYCLDTFRRGDLAGAANINVVACSRLRGLTHGTDPDDAPRHHTPTFRIDESGLDTGVRAYAYFAVDYLMGGAASR
jgi:two-component system, NarL family, sensor kinase